MKRIIVFFISVISVFGSLSAQDKDIMFRYQTELQGLFERVKSAPTDNERYLANEQVLQLFNDALAEYNSFKWKWQFDKMVSVLTSPDDKFRIITWPVLRDDGTMECFGFVQSYNEKEEYYDVFLLQDRSDEILNREESVLTVDSWFGMVYQDLITTHHDGRTFYTLLGWNGVDNVTERKVIEPITFHHSTPQFGQNLFRREKNIRRVVLEYTNNAMVNLCYDEQTLRTTETKRTKDKKGKVHVERIDHDEKVKMIIFDKCEPQIPGMEGLYQYYIPSGQELAYVFNEGKWELKDNAFGLLTDEKLNKEFAPIQKKAPAYIMGRKKAQQQDETPVPDELDEE